MTGMEHQNSAAGDSSTKGNEDKKIFVGGLAAEVTDDDVKQYFSQYGEVVSASVKIDRYTGRSRGFAFVEFSTSESAIAAQATRDQTIKGKQVEVKPAKSREDKKIFVGGLPAELAEEALRAHFEQYGKIEDIEWPKDKMTNQRRNFAFIIYEEEPAADKASLLPKQTVGERECDVKKAIPQHKRFPGGARGGRGGFRGGRGGGPNWYNWQQAATMGFPDFGAAAAQQWYGYNYNTFPTPSNSHESYVPQQGPRYGGQKQQQYNYAQPAYQPY